MVLDFVMSRSMMIVGGLLLAGAAAGTYQFMTGIPEGSEATAFARAWAKPFQEITTGVGDDRTTIKFGPDFAPGVLPVTFRGQPVEATLYRDALVIKLDEHTRRVPFLAAERMHLWYSSNAPELDAMDLAAADEVALSLQVDLGKPLVLQRRVNATGEAQIYVSHVVWSVRPGSCVWKVDEDSGVARDCGDIAAVLLDWQAQPVTREFTVTLTGAARTSQITAQDGVIHLEGGSREPTTEREVLLGHVDGIDGYLEGSVAALPIPVIRVEP